MNTSDITTHPFGYWITAVNRLMRAEFATVFADEGITRRDWRLLNRIAGTAPGNAADHRRVHGHRLHRLIELGWIERTRDGWSITESGALAQQRLGAGVDEIRSRVANVLSEDEYAAMTASLEKIAREFGWEEGKPLPRGHRHQHRPGFGPRGHHGDHGHRHSGRHGFGPRGFHHPMTPAMHIHLHAHG